MIEYDKGGLVPAEPVRIAPSTVGRCWTPEQLRAYAWAARLIAQRALPGSHTDRSDSYEGDAS